MRGRPNNNRKSSNESKLMVWFIKLQLDDNSKRMERKLKEDQLKQRRSMTSKGSLSTSLAAASEVGTGTQQVVQLVEGQAQIRAVYICEGDNSAQTGPSWYEYEKRKADADKDDIIEGNKDASKTAMGSVILSETPGLEGLVYPKYLSSVS